MAKRALTTERAPRPAGPYSQGLVVAGLVFVAGQGGFNPETGELVSGIRAQTAQTLANIEAVLAAGGSSLANMVKVSVFLASLDEFDEMNEVYSHLVPEPRPVRTTVEAGLPPQMRIEIDAIAEV